MTGGKKRGEKNHRPLLHQKMTVLQDNLILWFSYKQFTIPTKEFYCKGRSKWTYYYKNGTILHVEEIFIPKTLFYLRDRNTVLWKSQVFTSFFLWNILGADFTLFYGNYDSVESKQNCNNHIFNTRTENQKKFQFVQKKKTTLKQCPWNFIAFFHFYTWSSFLSVIGSNCVYVFYL